MTVIFWGCVRCPECFALVPVTAMEEDSHICDDGQLAAAQVNKAREELEGFAVPKEWETKRTEFDRWLEGR